MTGSSRLRPAATLYVACIVALAVGGGVLGLRLLQAGGADSQVHLGPPGLGVPKQTSFGVLEVESVSQIRGLTPKALAGMTHGIQSLVKVNQMQVQLVIALRNASAHTIPFDPAAFTLGLGRPGGKVERFASVTTSVRAGRLAARSAMETTIGFVIPRFNPKGTRISLELRDEGRPPPALDLGPVRPGGSRADVQATLEQGHQH